MTDRLRVAVVGCGDVLYRHYLPPLAALGERVEIVGFCAASLASAERAVSAVQSWSPSAAAFTDLTSMLESVRPSAVFNLTPAPLHAAVTAECLRAGSDVYSEKPIASSIAEADALVAEARKLGRLLMVAPASAATRQVRWIRDVIDSGRLGRPTLAVAWIGNMGPAAWREYTGDATVFYGPTVGPVRDVGIYRLHELTALLGPVRRISAMGTIAIPERTRVGGSRAGETISVTTPDHVMIQLEFASGVLGQLIASFAIPASRAPWLEVHLTGGTISRSGDPFAADDPASFFVMGDAGAGDPPLATGWNEGQTPPPPLDEFPLIGRGVEHFVDAAAGLEPSVLTPEHARHVLEVVLAAYESIETGRTVDLATAF